MNKQPLYHFYKYQPRPLKVGVNNEIYDKDYTTVGVANGRYYGGGFKVAPHAELNDNKLDIYLVKKMKKLEMAKTILSMQKGNHEKSDKVIILSSSEICIKSDVPFKSNIDGEVLEDTTFNISTVHNGITLYNNKELISKVLKK